MNPEIIVSALLNLLNAFAKSFEWSHTMVNMIFVGTFPRYKPYGSWEGSYPLKVLRDFTQCPHFPQAHHDK